ncbi:ribosomal large subunit pseudouridine synthase B [mine drainage metagenome]|uniref:Ribosomal large subunit pseudouridine synthase B n=1 Tax=mine drainage metagenome TaxID=410659 RepID=A0A1J5QDK2_9ZZZZ
MKKPAQAPASLSAPTEATSAGERLSKKVASLLHCSRRQAEQTIEGGWVQVNGKTVEEPMVRITDQSVVIDPQASPMALTEVTLLLHKPAGFDAMAVPGQTRQRVKPAQQLLQPATRARQDEAAQRVLKRHFAKLSACVPLETGASGLVVFTQDWRVLRKLTEDAALIEHELLVEVQGEVAPEILHRLNSPPASEREASPSVKVSINSTSDTGTRLRFAIKGTHPGLIAALCERAGLPIISMKRLRIGRVALAQLPEGQWRYLQGFERF